MSVRPRNETTNMAMQNAMSRLAEQPAAKTRADNAIDGALSAASITGAPSHVIRAMFVES